MLPASDPSSALGCPVPGSRPSRAPALLPSRPRLDSPRLRVLASRVAPHLRSCTVRDEDGGNLRSVRRAVTALELIAEAGELGVSELGRRLDVHKATASRLVSTLAERGLLERDPVNEKYRLGFGLVRLAGAAMAGLDIVREAHPGCASRTMSS